MFRTCALSNCACPNCIPSTGGACISWMGKGAMVMLLSLNLYGSSPCSFVSNFLQLPVPLCFLNTFLYHQNHRTELSVGPASLRLSLTRHKSVCCMAAQRPCNACSAHEGQRLFPHCSQTKCLHLYKFAGLSFGAVVSHVLHLPLAIAL